MPERGDDGRGTDADGTADATPRAGSARRSRRQAERDASAALHRMFDGPATDGTQQSPAVAGPQDRAIHDAVMAGFDAFAGETRHAGGDATAGEPPTTRNAIAGGLAVALAASDEEEMAAAHAGVEVPGTPAGSGQSTSWDSRFDDDSGDLEEDMALAEISGPRQRFNPLAALGRSMSSGLGQAGEMTWLTGSVIKSAITRPKGYWGETKEQIYSALKLCWVPMIISVTAFGIGAPGLQGGNVFTIFGVPEREGSFIVATGIREFAPWIDAMIVAGVVGTAITADIGARRIREEIDAMEVLGVDPIRELVLPRILSTAIITGLFDIVALLVGIVGGYIASVLLLGASTAGYTSQFFSQANVPDLVGSFAKTFLFGAVVGVVCCYKGMRASGGPSGVGKAVNSAVVISFALIWTINYVFTNTLLGFAPSTQVFH